MRTSKAEKLAASYLKPVGMKLLSERDENLFLINYWLFCHSG